MSRIVLRNAHSGEIEWSEEVEHQASTIAFSSDNRFVAFGHLDGEATVWDLATHKQLATLGEPDHESKQRKCDVTALAFSPDGSQLIIGYGFLDQHRTAFGPNPRVLNWRTGIEVDELHEHINACSATLILSRFNWLLTTNHEGTVYIWDARTLKLIKEFQLHARDGVSRADLTWGNSITGIASSQDEDVVAMASESGNIGLYAISKNGKEPVFTLVNNLRGHADAVLDVTFSHDGLTLASCSSDRTVRLWHAQTGRELMQLGDGMFYQTVRFSMDTTQLIASGTPEGDSSARLDVWQIPVGDIDLDTTEAKK
jgi:WD40 repeat protein